MTKSKRAEITCLIFGAIYLATFITTQDFDFMIISNVFLAVSFAIGGNENETN